MGIISQVPHFEAIIPAPILSSLQMKDSLREQRQEAAHLLREGHTISSEYWENGQHALVTSASAKWGLRHTDQTTLQPNRSEDRAWLERIAWEAKAPIGMRASCTYFDKLGPVIHALEEHPHIGIACVTGFPHGHRSPQAAFQEIKKFAKATEGIPNFREADSVMYYLACMEGNHALAEDVLKAESEACQEFGLTWKPILNVGVDAHAKLNTTYGNDFFRSVYDRTMMILRHGGNPKTSTGQSAEPPLHDFDPKDAGHPAAALPMLIATRDYNAEHGTRFFNKISGGVESELDVAVFRHFFDRLYPDDPAMVDRMAMGANYRLRKRLINYLIEQNDPDVDPSYALPYGLDMEAIPAAMMGGLRDPNPLPAHWAAPGVTRTRPQEDRPQPEHPDNQR